MFVLATGDIFMHSGFLDLVENRDEVAAVLGHEVAHVVQGHLLDGFKHRVEDLPAEPGHDPVPDDSSVRASDEPSQEPGCLVWESCREQVSGPPVVGRLLTVPVQLGLQWVIAEGRLEDPSSPFYSPAWGPSRKPQEAEADSLGVGYAEKAGYDPAAFNHGDGEARHAASRG